MRVDGKAYEKDEGLCEVMNGQLQSVFVLEDKEEIGSERQRSQGMPDLTVEDEVLDFMKKLDARKSMELDGVSGQVLQECAEQVMGPVFYIINYLLKNGKLLKEWKKADIAPVHKEGQCLLSVLYANCARRLSEKVNRFSRKERDVNKRQFGFREGSSLTANHLSFCSRVTNSEKNHCCTSNLPSRPLSMPCSLSKVLLINGQNCRGCPLRLQLCPCCQHKPALLSALV